LDFHNRYAAQVQTANSSQMHQAILLNPSGQQQQFAEDNQNGTHPQPIPRRPLPLCHRTTAPTLKFHIHICDKEKKQSAEIEMQLLHFVKKNSLNNTQIKSV